jgi:hypothetical protein
VKGATLLYGAASATPEQLLAVAEAGAASTALWKAKRSQKRAEAAAQREAAARGGGGGRGGGRGGTRR